MAKHRIHADWRQRTRNVSAAVAVSAVVFALTDYTPTPEDSTQVGEPQLSWPATSVTAYDALHRAEPATAPIRRVPAPALRPAAPHPAAPSPPPAARRPAPAPRAAGSLQWRVYLAAQRYVNAGIPYRYGGKDCTPHGSGCDCSAFVQMVLREAGDPQPYRTSYGLKAWAIPISRAQAQPGDLVFYTGHVGIVAPGGRIIDHGGGGTGHVPGALERLIYRAPGGPTFGRIPG